MHRRPLLETLERYLELFPEERVAVDHVRQFVRVHEDCFERSCRDGHITGSAWIVSRDGSRFLLAYHRKLDRWLQLGGHADGDNDPAAVAMREAQEESGLGRLELLGPNGTRLPLDVDVHLIPADGGEPAHLHHDIRYLLVADDSQELVVSDESKALRWFPYAEAEEGLGEESLRRMARKAAAVLGKTELLHEG